MKKTTSNMPKEPKRNLWLPVALVAAMLLVLVGGQSVLKAQSPQSVTIINQAEGGIVINLAEMVSDFVGELLGGGTRFPNGISADTTSPAIGQVRGTTSSITGTSTIEGYALGATRFEAVSFAAAATTTPGGWFSIPNTGEVKICRDVIVDISTHGGGGSFTFSVGTTTSETEWSASGGSLIASTTVATSSPFIFDQRTFKGSFFGGTNNGVLNTTFTDQYRNATPTTPWIWSNGDFLSGAFDSGANSVAQGNASSSDYTSNVGAVYVECFQR